MDASEKKPSERDTKDGTKGFSPQLGGHAKADHSHTSSFDAGPPDYTVPGYPASNNTAMPGTEENGQRRHPATSAVARVKE